MLLAFVLINIERPQPRHVTHSIQSPPVPRASSGVCHGAALAISAGISGRVAPGRPISPLVAHSVGRWAPPVAFVLSRPSAGVGDTAAGVGDTVAGWAIRRRAWAIRRRARYQADTPVLFRVQNYHPIGGRPSVEFDCTLRLFR